MAKNNVTFSKSQKKNKCHYLGQQYTRIQKRYMGQWRPFIKDKERRAKKKEEKESLSFRRAEEHLIE